MLSRNLPLFIGINALLFIATLIGMVRNRPMNQESASKTIEVNVPNIGSVQVLNGYGVAGAADNVADFLRAKKFDVKNIGNASSFNYPFTMVISRTRNMSIARQIAAALHTDHCVLMRTEDQTYDVTVVIGPDYGERIR